MRALAAVALVACLAGCADLRFAWTATGTYNLPPPPAAVPAAPARAASA